LSYDDAPVGGDIDEQNLSSSAKTWQHFTLEVPAGLSSFNATTTGSNGDADLYVRQGSKPTTNDYGCRSTGSDSNEQCRMNNPGVTANDFGVIPANNHYCAIIIRK
jgi:serine protease